LKTGAAATVVGVALAAVHAALIPALVAATSRPPLEIEWPGTLAADVAATGRPSARATVDHDGAAPGLVWTRWSVAYRGGITRSVGMSQLVGPFQDPAAPPCSGRLVVGQRLLDDGAAGTGTVAALIAAELGRELAGTDQPGAGTFRRVDAVRVSWAEFASHPRELGLFPAEALRAPVPTGMLRAEAVLVFDRVKVPVTIGAVPRVDGGSLGFTVGVRARLEFDSQVLNWVNAKVGGDRIVSKVAAGQLDTALLAALGPPPPLTLPDGPTLTVELCPDRAVEIHDGGWAAVPLRWKLGAAVAIHDGGPPIRPPARGPMTLPPPDVTAALTLDLELDGLNGLLFELWRTGWLDRQLDQLAAHERFNHDDTVATYLTLRLSPLRLRLPPTLRPTAGGGLALDVAARVDLADRDLLTPGHAWASLALALHGPGIAAEVGVTALELSCEPSPGRLQPCYGDIVAAIRDAAPGVHGQLADTLTTALAAVFVDQRLSTRGAPAALELTRARARLLADGDGRAVRVELDARIAAPTP